MKKNYQYLPKEECLQNMFDSMGLAPIPDGAQLLPIDCEMVSICDGDEISF